MIVSDTDHLFGVGGDRAWVWKSFTRGLNPIFMDPLEVPHWESVRQTMGLTLACTDRMDLSAMRPRGDLASSGYCLANPGEEYLVYVPLEVPWLESRRVFRRLKQPIRNIRRLFATKVTLDLFILIRQSSWWSGSTLAAVRLRRPVPSGAAQYFLS